MRSRGRERNGSNTSVYRLTKGGTVHVLCDVSIERVCASGEKCRKKWTERKLVGGRGQEVMACIILSGCYRKCVYVQYIIGFTADNPHQRHMLHLVGL